LQKNRKARSLLLDAHGVRADGFIASGKEETEKDPLNRGYGIPADRIRRKKYWGGEEPRRKGTKKFELHSGIGD